LNPDSNPLKGLVQKITDLPTLPHMMATITRLMQEPRTSAEELGRAIATDPALASKVLKLVNSAFYGYPGRIKTITQAVVILGFSTIRNVVLTTSVLKAFGGPSGTKGFDVEEFWRHSLLTGALAKSLALEKDAPFTEETFIAGLLHDMGRMVLGQKLAPEFAKVAEYHAKHGGQWLAAEMAVLGLTHGEIGGWLARRWNLPLPFAEVMEFHHRPPELSPEEAMRQSDTGNLIPLIHAADAFAKDIKDGTPQLESRARMDPKIWTQMGLEGDNWDRFQRRTQDEISKAKSFLEIL